jgi:hypothetical protein
MAETDDPVVALDARDIPTRAAATRDLALSGEAGHVERLLAAATTDRSPGVRLGAAAAVADILSRHRLDRNGEIDAPTREAWLRVVAGVDPGTNTGLFQVCGTLGLSGGVQRVLSGLRDPRADVRQGACVGLWRLAASGAVNGDQVLEGSVVAVLDDPRVRIETRAEVARVCSNVGFTRALPAARRIADAAERAVATVAKEAVARMENPPGVQGAWVDAGLDAGEVNPKAKPRARAVFFSASDAVVVDGTPRRGPLLAPVRTLWLKVPGEPELAPAVQAGRVTWYRAEPDDLLDLGDGLIEKEAWNLLDAIDGALPHCAATLRIRGRRLLVQGQAEAASQVLEAALAMKKAPVDVGYWYGLALCAVGREAEARPHLERFIQKAPKRSPLLPEARRRLGE